MHARGSRLIEGWSRQVSSIIDIDRCSYRGSVEGQINKRLKRSRSIHQISRSYRKGKSFLNQSTRYRGAGEIAIKEVSSQLLKTIFRDVKNIDMNAIQHATQITIQSTY